MHQQLDLAAADGNIGQALAYSGARRGIPVTVVAAQIANPLKIERMQELDTLVIALGRGAMASGVGYVAKSPKVAIGCHPGAI